MEGNRDLLSLAFNRSAAALIPTYRCRRIDMARRQQRGPGKAEFLTFITIIPMSWHAWPTHAVVVFVLFSSCHG